MGAGMNHPESALQRQCIAWMRIAHPGIVCFAIPNGGRRGRIEAAIMKGEGVTAGVPDVFVALPRPPYAGLFVEFKSAKGRPTPAQRAMQERLVDAGYLVAEIRDFETWRRTIIAYIGKD